MVYMKDVTSLQYNVSSCNGCSRCTQVCPRNVFVMQGNKAVLTSKDKCIECGACMNNCASGAISVKPGVGCAAAMFDGLLRFGDMEKGTCGCESDDDNRGCC